MPGNGETARGLLATGRAHRLIPPVTPVVLAQAWQSWKSARTVFALAVIALAVGIASTTAIYTVVNAVMLKPLAYEHGERYAQLFSSTTVGNPDNRGSLRLADLFVYQQAQSIDLFGWFKPQEFTLTSPGPPQHVEGASVTTRLAHGPRHSAVHRSVVSGRARRGHLARACGCASARTRASSAAPSS